MVRKLLLFLFVGRVASQGCTFDDRQLEGLSEYELWPKDEEAYGYYDSYGPQDYSAWADPGSQFSIPLKVQYRLVGEGVNNKTQRIIEKVLQEMEENVRCLRFELTDKAPTIEPSDEYTNFKFYIDILSTDPNINITQEKWENLFNGEITEEKLFETFSMDREEWISYFGLGEEETYFDTFLNYLKNFGFILEEIKAFFTDYDYDYDYDGKIEEPVQHFDTHKAWFEHLDKLNPDKLLTIRIENDSADSGISGHVNTQIRLLTMSQTLKTLKLNAKKEKRRQKRSWKYVFMHEMFHVFGIAHMQRRNDRDEFIQVIEENIVPENLPQYAKCNDCQTWGPYECNSIMHYKQGTFGKDNLPTMKGFGPNCTEFGNKEPTENDWNSLRQKLGCNEEQNNLSDIDF